MKKILLVAGIAAFLSTNQIRPALANDDAFTKFGRAMSNIITSPMELYAQPLLMAKEHDPSIAVFGGLCKGTAMFLAREVVGIYELVTFPIPIPGKYRPIIDPPTTFTDWNNRKP